MSELPRDVRPSKGARSISAQIRRAIQSGIYLHGEQLPAERDLSETYSSSRSTVRKALDNLEKIGLVVRKVGAGTFVNYSGPQEVEVENVVEQISPLQLIDARVGFERQMARLAVVHATVRDIENLEIALGLVVAAQEDKAAFAREDSEFHLLLAKSTRNPLIIQLYNQINEVRGHSQWLTARESVLQKDKMKQYNKFHSDIFLAIKNRDQAAAIEAINGHMELAREDLIGTLLEE